MQIDLKYAISDRVAIDDWDCEQSLVGVISAVIVYGTAHNRRVEYQVNWWAERTHSSAWFTEDRLTAYLKVASTRR